MQQTLKKRLLAFGIHLAISALIGCLAFALIYLVWFPRPYFLLTSGRDLFLLMLGCDAVLGPLLTLVIFNVMKPRQELRRDLMLIACIQIAALGYGLHVVYEVRPLYVVSNGNQFNVVAANDVTTDPKLGGSSGFSLRSLMGPQVVGVKMPDNEDERQAIVWSVAKKGVDITSMPKYFIPYDEIKDVVKRKARTAKDFAKQYGIAGGQLAGVEAEYLQQGKPIGFVTVVAQSSHKYAAGVVSLESGELLRVEPVEEENVQGTISGNAK